MLNNFQIVCTLCLSVSLASANNAFFIGARRHKPRWQGHPLTITGGYAPYQEDYHPDLSPYKYIYRPYYYQGGQSEDDSLEGYDYKDYPDNTRSFIPDYYTEDAAAALPLNDYQQALMRQNFIDFLIRQGPNMYKDHKKMKYMYRATNTYPKPIVESHEYNYDTNIFNQGTGINNYESYWRDKDESEERDHNNRTYVYGIPKYSESDEPKKTAKPNVFTTKDLRENNPFEANKEKNKVKAKDEDDVEVKELESQRNNLQDIISSYPLGAAGASVQEEVEDEYSPSIGKSIKDLVSKDNMDENVQINDKPLWKQDDRSWISSLYKRAPVAPSIPEEHSSNININHNETPPDVATTTERSNAVETEDSTESTEEDKTSSSSSSSSSNETNETHRPDKTHPRDVYETIKEMLNEEDKFHQHGGIDVNKKKRSFVSTEDELTKELGALRKS